jgi:hypothetical protein
VEPAVPQNLPGNTLLLPARDPAAPGLLAVECDPQIITLPGAVASLATAGHPGNARPVTNADGRPEIAPPGQRPASPSWRDSPADAVPAWPPRPHPLRRPTQSD